MNKILVNKNKIVDYQDDFIKIVDGNIYIYKDSEYEIEYIDSDNVEINFYINDSRVRIRESSFDNNIRVKNTYNINSGYLRVDKFYNNKNTYEDVNINLNNVSDRIDYNFANIGSGDEEYVININHNCEKTVSYINNKAIALKNSRVSFIVNSRVDKNCIKSILDQNTRIVTMGECDTKIQPNMFIELDDVEARHGSVVGTFKNDQVFYLMSKGISYNNALKLLIKGYLLSKIEVSQDVRVRIMEIIDRYWR